MKWVEFMCKIYARCELLSVRCWQALIVWREIAIANRCVRLWNVFGIRQSLRIFTSTRDGYSINFVEIDSHTFDTLHILFAHCVTAIHVLRAAGAIATVEMNYSRPDYLRRHLLVCVCACVDHSLDLLQLLVLRLLPLPLLLQSIIWLQFVEFLQFSCMWLLACSAYSVHIRCASHGSCRTYPNMCAMETLQTKITAATHGFHSVY